MKTTETYIYFCIDGYCMADTIAPVLLAIKIDPETDAIFRRSVSIGGFLTRSEAARAAIRAGLPQLKKDFEEDDDDGKNRS